MGKKVFSILVLLSLLAVSTWCLIFNAYYDTSEIVNSRLIQGDWAGALGSIKYYQKNPLSYPVYNAAKLKKFRFRLNYLEGVVYNSVGNSEAASLSFRKAADSQEVAIGAAAKYNLAYYAIQEDGLDRARTLLNETLMLDPDDVAAKINLELILKRIQARQQMEVPEKLKKQETIQPQAEPGEQWRLEVPDEESEGSGSSTGQSFL